MKTCPYCAESIQDAAIVCKHCSRELPATPPVPAPPAAPSGGSRLLTLVVYAILAGGAITLVMALSGVGKAPESAASLSTIPVHVGWNQLQIAITNDGAPEGREVTVYLNGTPPFTYSAKTTVPAQGQTARLRLNDFTMKDGTRFNPLTQAVTEAWVGGGGYDYAKFTTRR